MSVDDGGISRCGCDDCRDKKKLKGASMDFLIMDDYGPKKVWTVGQVSILSGLVIFAGIGLWRIVEIICGLI